MTSRVRTTLALALLLGASTANAELQVPIMPLDEVKVGMKGHGRTVFEGTTIESFDCTVIGILRSFDFEMDMILIRIETSPVVTRKYGVLGGMSGSPIYVDGKLIGALAYGWPFQTEPIAGVTPIQQMLDQFEPGLTNGPASQGASSQASSLPAPPAAGSLRPEGGALRLGEQRFADVVVAPNRQEAETLVAERPDRMVLTPVTTPLFVSGIGRDGIKLLEELLAPHNIQPLQAGSLRVAADTPFEFAPGAAVTASMVTGDIELTAVGTLTYVDDEIALAFGHPFLGLGEVNMPMSAGYVHTVIASLMGGNKLGGAITPVGRVTQDRPTCIGGRLGETAETISLTYNMTDASRGARKEFTVNLMRHPMLSDMYTVLLMQAALGNVVGMGFNGAVDTTVELVVESDGGQPQTIIRKNSFDSRAAQAYGVNPLMDLYMTLTLLRQNPFGEVPVQSVKVDMTFDSDRRFATLERVQAMKQTVKPGETVDLDLYLKPYGGKERQTSVAVEIPAHAPVGPVAVVVMGGSDSFYLKPRINPDPLPRDVDGLIRWLNNSISNNSVVTEVVLPTTGIEFAGHQLPDFPGPIAEALFTSRVDGLRMLRDVDERILPMNEVISGVGAVMLEVVGPDGERGDDEGGYTPDFGGPAGPGMEVGGPGQMMMAAIADSPGLTRLATLSSSTGWLRTMTTGPTPLVIQHQARLDALLRAMDASRPTATQRPLALPRSDSRWLRQASTGTPTLRQAEAPERPDAAPPAGPPSIDADLNLKDPPALPGWSELSELERRGDLAEEPATGGDEPTTDTGDADSEDGEPIARPVKVWSVGLAEEFIEGRFQGTFPIDSGQVGLAPASEVLGQPEVERVWMVSSLADGSVLVGAWSDEAVLFKLADGELTELFRTNDAAVTAACELPDGSLLVGCAPSGRIYRLRDGVLPMVLADLDDPYIWSILPDGADGCYAATGHKGRLYQIDEDGQADVVLQSSDRHVLALAPRPAGGVYAGSFPRGKVYQVTADGVETVYQTPEAGVSSLAATSDGSIYIGTFGGGQIYRVDNRGDVTEMLEKTGGHNVYSMLTLEDRVYAAINGPGRLLRIDSDRAIAQVHRTDEPFLLGLTAVDGDSLVMTVAGSGEVVRLDLRDGDRGTYLSPVHDAEMVANWGRLRWQQETGGKAVIALSTRSGNTARPDAAWSDWSEATTANDGAEVTSPPARYIQFRATFFGDPGQQCRLRQVELFYRTRNRAPRVKIEGPKAGQVVRGKVDLEWDGEDPDGDQLRYRVYYAAVDSDEWLPALPPLDDDGGDPGEGEDEFGGDDPDRELDDPPADDDGEFDEAPRLQHENRPVGVRQTPPAGAVAVTSSGPLPWQPVRFDPSRSERRLRAVQAEGAGTAMDDDDAPEEADDEPREAEDLTDGSSAWDTREVPDGRYRIKIVATDARRNPDDPQTVEVIGPVFLIDNSRPYALHLPGEEPAAPPASITFADDESWLTSAEWRVNDGEWLALLPVDGLFDQATEELATPELPTEPGEHVYSLRVRDAAGNVLHYQWPFVIAAPAEE